MPTHPDEKPRLISGMNSRALNTVSAVAWSMLLLCIVAFLVTSVFAVETQSVRSTTARDESIRVITSSTDLRLVQGLAIIQLKVSCFTSAIAMILCRLFLGVLLIIGGGAAVTLRQVGRLRGKSSGPMDAAPLLDRPASRE